MGSRTEVLDMDIIDALETLILIRRDDEEKYNTKKLEQVTEFESMLISAYHVNGADNKEVQKLKAEHIEKLTTMIGEAKEKEAEDKMAQFQWPKEVQELNNK